MILTRPLEILLVEDNPGDIRLVQEAFKEDNMVVHNLHITYDGIEAIKFLNKQEKYSEVPLPDIILLDMNLPRKSGREVLHEIRLDKRLKQLPVCVLTISETDSERFKMDELPASYYLDKPV